MDEIPESPDTTFHDAQIPDTVCPEPFSQTSFEQLLVFIEPIPAQSPPSAFERPTMEEDGGRKDGYGNAATFSGDISQANSTPNMINCKEDDAEFKPESAQYSILIEDRYATFQHDNTMLKSGGSFGAEKGLNLLCDPVSMARGISHSTDVTLTDSTDLYGDTRADEAETILWRHVAFHIVRGPDQGPPNNLVAQITVPQTRENESSRIIFVIQHNPNQLFDILGYLLALAIHNDIFATGLRDVKEVYQIEIPPQMNSMKLEMKRTKSNMPIFRRSRCLTNQPRSPMTIFRELYGEAGESSIASYHDNEPYPEVPSVFIFATGHGEHFSFPQTIIPNSDVERDQEKVSSARRARDALQHWQGERGKVDRKGQKEKLRQTSKVSEGRKRAAPLSEPRKLSR